MGVDARAAAWNGSSVSGTPFNATTSGAVPQPYSAKPADLDAVFELEAASFSDPWSRASFDELLLNERATFGVIRSAVNELLAYGVVLLAADEAELANIAVVPASRGRGLGDALLAWLLQSAAARGARTIFLEVRASNAAARRLYEKQGFSRISVRKAYYRNPTEDAVVMKADL